MSPPNARKRPGAGAFDTQRLAGGFVATNGARRVATERALTRRLLDADALFGPSVACSATDALEARVRLVEWLEGPDSIAVHRAVNALRLRLLAEVEQAARGAWSRWQEEHRCTA